MRAPVVGAPTDRRAKRQHPLSVPLALVLLLATLSSSRGRAAAQQIEPLPSPTVLLHGNWSEYGIATSAHSDHFLLAYRPEGEPFRLLLLDRRGNTLHATSIPDGAPGDEGALKRIVWSPADNAAAIEIAYDDVTITYVFAVESRDLRTLVYRGVASAAPVWSSNGDRLFFTPGVNDPTKARGLYAYQFASGTIFRLPVSPEIADGYSVNADRLLAFATVGNATKDSVALISVDIHTQLRSANAIARWDSTARKFLSLH
jgi:hypothetical protein